MVNAYIHSIEDFNDCSIEEVNALKKELQQNIASEKNNGVNDGFHPGYSANYSSIAKDLHKCYQVDVIETCACVGYDLLPDILLADGVTLRTAAEFFVELGYGDDYGISCTNWDADKAWCTDA